MEEYKKLLEQGFSKVPNILCNDELKNLREECSKIINDGNIVSYEDIENNFIDDLIENYNNSITQNTFFKTKIRPFVGISELIDKSLEKIFFNTNISKIIEDLLVKPKLSHCMIRLANSDSHFLGFHTDSDTTLSMSIFLDDVSNKDATTTFIPRSHLYPVSLKNKIEKINPKYFNSISRNSVGKAGDINLFFNKTVHGVKASDKGYSSNNMVLLLNFHSDYDKSHRNLLLKDNIKYNYGNNNSNKFISNYFELISNERKKRLQNKDFVNTSILKVFKKQKLPLINYITYYFLSITAFILKYLIFFYRKFLKKST